MVAGCFWVRSGLLLAIEGSVFAEPGLLCPASACSVGVVFFLRLRLVAAGLRLLAGLYCLFGPAVLGRAQGGGFVGLRRLCLPPLLWLSVLLVWCSVRAWFFVASSVGGFRFCGFGALLVPVLAPSLVACRMCGLLWVGLSVFGRIWPHLAPLPWRLSACLRFGLLVESCLLGAGVCPRIGVSPGFLVGACPARVVLLGLTWRLKGLAALWRF